METQSKPRVITIYLSKGGVGKSTLVALLATFLAAIGYRVVIVDLDRQGSQSEIFGFVNDEGKPAESLHLVLKRRLDIMAALLPISRIPCIPGHQAGELYLVPGGPQTKEAIDEINIAPVRFKIASTLDVIRTPLQGLAGFADFVIMDMGPSDQIAALAGLVATHDLIIPTMTDFLSVSRIASVMDEIDVARSAAPALKVMGIATVMSRYYFGRLRKSKNVVVGEQFLARNYSGLMLNDKKGQPVDIPYDEAWREVMWMGENLLDAEISSKVKADALRFLNAVGYQLGLEEVERVG